MKVFTVLTVLLAMVYYANAGTISPLLNKDMNGDKAIQVMVKIKTPAGFRVNEKNVILDKQNIAKTTQKGIIDILSTRARKCEYKSYWIANAIYIKATPETIKKIANRPEVESIIPNVEFHVIDNMSTQNFREYRDGDTYNIGKMNVYKVWEELNIDGTGVKVGVADSGLNTDLDYTKGKFVEGRCFVTGEVGTDIHDGNGHGTHVCGTIIGGHVSGPLYEMSWFWPTQVGSYDGNIGIAPGAKLYFAKVMNDKGQGDFNDILAGIQWLADPDGKPDTHDGVQTINMSLGASESVPEMRPYFKEITQTGVIVVVANGNSGKKCGSPADFPEVISIGATDSSDSRASFSSIGPGIDGGIKPDVCAPGVKIISYFKDKLMKLDGTSMASPNACGVVALMLQANPELTPKQVKQILKDTAVDLGASGADNYYGAGRIDAYEAVKAALGKTSVLTSNFRTLKKVNDEAVNALELYKAKKISDNFYIAYTSSQQDFIRKMVDYIVKNNISDNEISATVADFASSNSGSDDDNDGLDDLEPLIKVIKAQVHSVRAQTSHIN